MGFRGEQLTTAEGVDTGDPTGPGVRVFQRTASNGFPQGVVEFRDGLGNTGELELTSYQDDQGGGFVRYLGSDFTLRGPDGAVTVPAALILLEREAAAGGYQAEAVVRGDVIELRGAVRVPSLVEPAASSGGWNPGWRPRPADGYQETLQFTRTSDNMVTVSGLAEYAGGTTATSKIFNISGDFRPRGLKRQVVGGSVGETPRLFDVRPDGLYLRGALPSVGAFIVVNGTYPGVLATT